MITVTLATVAGLGVYCVCFYAGDFGRGWSVALGTGAFLAVQIFFSLAMRKRVMAEMGKVQRILETGQKALQAKTARWQFRPPGSMQQAQNEIARDTKVFVKEAIAAVDSLKKFKIWVPMIEKQMATARLQLEWMIKDFDAVDADMKKAIVADGTMAAMFVARAHMRGEGLDAIRKTYSKYSKRLKYNENALIAGAWSWILVKKGLSEKDAAASKALYDEAFKVLTEALKNSDNPQLKANHVSLMNNRPGHFTNSGLGDRWYSLWLEEPKNRAPRQHMKYR
ncbi:MAG: hypothetical protein J6W80_06415 [Kiritimatiellae bacterium]|nr:hypothetical protein [Kiritimatiellia bacterium]